MSKLVEKLRQTSKGAAQPIGFRGTAAAAQSGSPMVLVASLTLSRAETSPSLLDKADAMLLKEAPGKNPTAFEGIPWGTFLKEGTTEEVDRLKEAGCDFVIFEPGLAPVVLLGEEGLGKIVQIDASLSDGMVRAVERLSIDGIYLKGDSHLSVHWLMFCQHVANLVRKPVMAGAPLSITREALGQFQNTGLLGLVVELDRAGDKALSRLRETISSLPWTRRGARERYEPTIVQPVVGPGREEEETEEPD